MSAIPLLLHVFPTFRVGGSQARFAVIANHFARKYRHAILAMNGAYDCLQRLSPDVQVERWDVAAPKRNTLGNVLAFRRVLHARNPDLLITYNWGAIEWALANRPRIVPHIHIEDGFGPAEAERPFIRRALFRRVALAHCAVVVPSRTLFRVASNTWGASQGRLSHIPNGIDLARFATASPPTRISRGPGPVIGTVAALRPEKNIARLLRAFHDIREASGCRLVVVGDGPDRAQLESLAARLLPPECVHFMGHVGEVEHVYAMFDIFALSSDTEQMPTSLMEAMAAGLPVVSTDVGDVSGMVAAENRPFVVPPDDRLFAEALSRMVSDQAARAEIGTANRVVANARFGMARMLADYDALFSSLANPRVEPRIPARLGAGRDVE